MYTAHTHVMLLCLCMGMHSSTLSSPYLLLISEHRYYSCVHQQLQLLAICTMYIKWPLWQLPMNKCSTCDVSLHLAVELDFLRLSTSCTTTQLGFLKLYSPDSATFSLPIHAVTLCLYWRQPLSGIHPSPWLARTRTETISSTYSFPDVISMPIQSTWGLSTTQSFAVVVMK